MFVSVFLLIIPLLAALSSLFIYRLRGKRQLFTLDLMQFMYAFVFSVMAFVWIKTFLFTLLKAELGVSITVNELFILDTIMSVLFLYIYAFIVMHSLTTSFRIQMDKDPLFDIFFHSEYIHLWLSHIVSYTGLMLVVLLLGIANVFFPLQIEGARMWTLLPVGLGVLGGVGTYIGVQLANPMQKRRITFTRLMKLLFGVYFSILGGVYFIYEPSFNIRFGFYWFCVAVFATCVFMTIGLRRSEKARNWFEQLIGVFQHEEWGDNIDLFPESNKNKQVKAWWPELAHKIKVKI